MLASRAVNVLCKAKTPLASGLRWASTAAEKDKYKIVVIGAGTSGQSWLQSADLIPAGYRFRRTDRSQPNL